MLQFSEGKKQTVRDELTRELAEAHQQLKEKVIKYSNNVNLSIGRGSNLKKTQVKSDVIHTQNASELGENA